ncbi:amidase [Oceanimonas doudoroffii]|uniref:Amidase n=1 Tax=Oceanimonas doudoroffii TaxID=84158 RepID=A0A233RFV1_9GAMM|nr:amidase [Oceanimonas doudoroffii]OXY82267.1 amidase [Oceanimonas doudoroffii]
MAAQPDVTQSWRLGALELAAAYAAGTLTPLAVVEALGERIARLNPELNAFITFNPAAAEEAAAATARWAEGRPLSPLDGVPLTVKDHLNTQGLATTWGNRALAGNIASEDELAVSRCRAAGLVILGKTNVPEFTLEGYTDNPLFGVTRNPWNPALTPGGSSGGAVAALAAGLGPLALGTDGGGSIRRPASHTGLVGLKPSIGAVARVGSLPQVMLDFEVVGPLARSAADAEALYRIISGPDVRDPASWRTRPEAPAGKLRIHYVPRFGDQPLHAEIAGNVEQALAVFARQGHQVTRGELPFSLEPVDKFWPMLGAAAVAAIFRAFPETEPEAAGRFRDMAGQGRQLSASDYLCGLDGIRRFRRTVAEAFVDIDIIVTPSAAALPWPAEQPYPGEIDGRPVGPRGHAIYTGWVNACGHPAINLPAAPSAAGLPIGFQLVAGMSQDELLLRLAADYERESGRGWQWPALAETK